MGNCGQYVDDEGSLRIRDFDFVEEVLVQRINEICDGVWATEPPLIFLTGTETTNKLLNKQRKRRGEEEKVFEPNFRFEVAKKKEYKGNRTNPKPFHFTNVLVYLLAHYDCVVAEGMEADDMLSVYQWRRIQQGSYDTVVCSRDKDLRITPGMHYGWECGKQPAYGPLKVEPLGTLDLKNGGKKIVGTGLKFFYSQLITGDSTDNIPGLPRGGPALAFKLLGDCEDEEECFTAVREAYENKYGDNWEEELMEQAKLLWMVRELTDEGKPVMWEMPNVSG